MNKSWQKTTLGQHVELLTGYPFKSIEYTNDEKAMRLLRGDNVVQGSIRWDDVKRWGGSTETKILRYFLKEGDFVIAMDRTWVKAGLKASMITKQDTPSLLVQRVARLRVKKGLYSKILPLLIRSHMFEQYVKGVQTETAVPHISPQQINDFPVLLPPLPEQKAIADLLSTWDEAIEKIERLVKVQVKMLKQISRWLLFGYKRLDNRKVNLSDGRYFKYPCDWELLKISKIAKDISARNGTSDEMVLSCSKYDGFVNSLDYFGKQVFSSDTSNYKVIKKGQFGYPSNHVEEGSIGLLEHCEKGIVSPIYVIFEVSKEKIYPPYLIKLLKTNIYKHIFQVTTSSSVDRRGGLRWIDFSKIRVPIPPLEEQQQIAETLNAAQKEIDLLRQLLDKYKSQKRGLMQKMLTGEWRVKPEMVMGYE